jgi:hypothetical protein
MRHRLFAVVATLLVVNLTLGAASAWEPAKGPLMTRWSGDVSPENALPEYPRPQMVREKWANLNGLWQYAIRPKAEGQPDKWDGEILVPFAIESALSGVKKAVKPDERLWYRRTFKTLALMEKQRLLLHFGAVDWECKIWVNGKLVGHHTGGYDPFTFDITYALKSERQAQPDLRSDNELVVAVTDPTDTGTQPPGKQVLKPHGIFYTAVTGIWQTVWLEQVPLPYIESLKIVPNIDRGVVEVTVKTVQGDKVSVKALDGKAAISEKSGQSGQTIELPIPNAKLWSPDHPHLYDLQVELSSAGKVIDTVNSYCGMRKIEVKKDAEGRNRLWLNNKVVFQYGPLDQGWWPDGLYTAPTDAALKYDIEMTKQLGFNMARKHVKVEPARWYYWCDKLGLLVWQDMVSGDANKTDESKANYRRELKAMIDALRNHPSIVMWVPFNEGWGQYDTPEVAKWVADYDPSRPVNEASGWHDRGSGHVSDMHNYPGPGMRPVEPSRVSVLGEFGGLGMPVKGHTWQAEKNWGYVSYDSADALTDAYVDLLTMMRPLVGEGLSAAVYTQTTDVEIEVNGLMTYDRERVKMDEARITAAAKKLYEKPPRMTVLVATSENKPQTWRYTTTKPDSDWMKSDFDDSGWQNGPGGFGTRETPRAVVGTVWNTPDIWIRRSFEVEELPASGQLMLTIHHDEDAEVFINGELVEKLPGHTRHYRPMLLEEKARKLLREGKNTIAVHCRQTAGGQFIDVGIVDVVEID